MKKLLAVLFTILIVCFGAVFLCSCNDSEEPTHRHVYGEWIETKGTCEKRGMRFKKCEICEQTSSVKMLDYGHEVGEFIVKKDPTDSENGLQQKTCALCQKVIKEYSTPKMSFEQDEFGIGYTAYGLNLTSEESLTLKELIFPSTYNNRPVTGVGFYSCINNIEKIYIPKTVEYLLGFDSEKIKEIEVDGQNQHFQSIDGNVYSKDGKKLITYARGKEQEDFILPNGVEEIDGCAFYASKLKNITLPDGLKAIRNNAFESCQNLENINIPDSVENIEVCAFRYCENLKFNQKDSLLYLGNEQNKYIYLVKGVDYTATQVTVDENCKFIAEIAFQSFENLRSITLPDGLLSIEELAFDSCFALESITIPDSVKRIHSAFYFCTGLKTIIFGENTKIESIEDNFYNCNIENAIIPTMAINAVKNNYLKNVVINSGTTIDEYAFSDLQNLEKVVISKSVIEIAEHAFYNCPNLTIYCEHDQQPSGYQNGWNRQYPDGQEVPTEWGYVDNN